MSSILSYPFVGLDLDDFLIVPAAKSRVSSRKEVNVYDNNKMLPLFTAPMDTVVDIYNMDIFRSNGIYPIAPRGSNFDLVSTKDDWLAIGLEEFDNLLKSDTKLLGISILVDIANGHMVKLIDSVSRAKAKFGANLTLMVGNVANPETYKLLSEAGADYCRIGIGNGGGCLTSQNVGIGFPMGTLINLCSHIKEDMDLRTKIVADGGMKNYDDVIKALALGADYVMLGSIFNKALESAGDTYKANIRHEGWVEPGDKVDQYQEDVWCAFASGAKFYKKFRGMSTKEVQRVLGNKEIKTSEGATRINPVEYTITGWVENFKHYLSSAMSYSDAFTLKEFRQNSTLVEISDAARTRFAK